MGVEERSGVAKSTRPLLRRRRVVRGKAYHVCATEHCDDSACVLRELIVVQVYGAFYIAPSAKGWESESEANRFLQDALYEALTATGRTEPGEGATGVDRAGSARESGEGDRGSVGIGVVALPAAPRSPIENRAGPGPIIDQILTRIGPINWHNRERAEALLSEALADEVASFREPEEEVTMLVFVFANGAEARSLRSRRGVFLQVWREGEGEGERCEEEEWQRFVAEGMRSGEATLTTTRSRSRVLKEAVTSGDGDVKSQSS